MWSIFVYFLIFFVPGLFAVLVFNALSRRRMECWTAISSALIYDLWIFGINLAGLRFIRGICCTKLQAYFSCISFIPKYILLSLVVGALLAVIAWLITRFRSCRRGFWHHRNKNCN